MEGVILMAMLQKFQCLCCGGIVVYDSASQKIKCPYCETEFEAESVQSYLEDLQDAQENDLAWDCSDMGNWRFKELAGLRIYACKRCGEFVCDSKMEVSGCPICARPVDQAEGLTDQKRPELVIPFALDKKSAKQVLKKQFDRKKLLPKVFKDEKHLEKLEGVYLPIWFFNANVEGKTVYKATQIRSRSDNTRDYTATMYYHVARAGSLDFPTVTKPGTSELNDELLKMLEPYDVQKATYLHTTHLEGYFAQQCDVGSDEWLDGINEQIKSNVTTSFRNTVKSYDHVTQQSVVLRLQNSNVQCILCPVWFLTIPWKRKKYTIALNGQTGKLAGNLPMDRKVFWNWYFSLFGAVAAISFLVSWLLWLL